MQFVRYLEQLASGDLGDSIKHSRPVTTLLIERLPTTIELTIMALFFAIALGIPLGLLSAYRRNSTIDVGTMMFANLGVSVPVFVLGLVLAFVFAIMLQGHAPLAAPVRTTARGVSVIPLAEVWGLRAGRVHRERSWTSCRGCTSSAA